MRRKACSDTTEVLERLWPASIRLPMSLLCNLALCFAPEVAVAAKPVSSTIYACTALRRQQCPTLTIASMAQLFRNIKFMFYGSKHFSKQGYAHAAKTYFDPSVMERRLDGKVCLVTGANQGLGLQTSQELAARGATLLMVCRNAERGQKAVEDIKAKTGNANVQLKVCDVSSMASVRQLVQDLTSTLDELHVVVNNAGVMVHERDTTPEGLDVNTATNTVGCWLLTQLLEPLLAKSAPSKVIFVSSGGMLTQPLEVDDLQNDKMKKYDGVTAYAKDKRRQVVMTERFAELWKTKGIHVYSMHPGWTTTEGVKKSIPGFYNFYQNKFRDLPEGADTIVYLALEDDSKLEDGGFYLDRKPQDKHLSSATKYTSAQVDALWSQLQKLTGLQPTAA